MTPKELECRIAVKSAAVIWLQSQMDKHKTIEMRNAYRSEARKCASDVAELVKQRAPETVALMERERGIS